MKKPNIIFYFTDQQRWDTINEFVSPNITSFANEGLNFSNAFTCQPVCGPARACIQTGVYATQNGCYINAIPLNPEQKTIAHHLNDVGYDTGYVGKWHLASGYLLSHGHYETKSVPESLRGGYKYWRASDVLEFTSDGSGGYVFDEKGNKCEFSGVRADKITDFALDFIDKKTEKPFFLFLSHIEPHHQNSSGKYECASEDEGKFDSCQVPKDLDFLKGNYKENYANYLACCNRLDYNFGRIVDKLKQKDIYENTIIIFSSDHGCHFKTRNIEYKRSCHDSSTHIPCIVGGAKIKSEKLENLVSLIDIPSTILSLAGVDVPKEYQGLSLIDVANESVERESVFIQISESHTGRAIRTKKYLYSIKSPIFNYLAKSSNLYFDDFLYDVEKDPYQKKNLKKDKNYIEIKKELRKMLIENMKNCGESEPKIKRNYFFNI